MGKRKRLRSHRNRGGKMVVGWEMGRERDEKRLIRIKGKVMEGWKMDRERI